MQNDYNDWILDIVNILSFVIGVQNLNMNNQQVKALEDHLNKQDEQYNKIIKLLEDKNSL